MFLTIVTRHLPSRGEFLAHNRASLAAQTDQDYEQQLLIDEAGRGVAWANWALRGYADAPVGDYVLMVDDDDMLADPGAIAALREAAEDRPDLIFVKVDHGPELGVLPTTWGQLPAPHSIGGSSVVCSRNVWRVAARAWAFHYAGDYPFVKAAFEAAGTVTWLDRVIVAVQRISRGRA